MRSKAILLVKIERCIRRRLVTLKKGEGGQMAGDAEIEV